MWFIPDFLLANSSPLFGAWERELLSSSNLLSYSNAPTFSRSLWPSFREIDTPFGPS